MTFRAPQITKKKFVLAKISAPHAKFLKNSPKESIFKNILENFDRISRFFGARSPSKLLYISVEDALRNILGSVNKYEHLKKSTKGDPLGRQGVEPLRGRRPTPLLNPHLVIYNVKQKRQVSHRKSSTTDEKCIATTFIHRTEQNPEKNEFEPI